MAARRAKGKKAQAWRDSCREALAYFIHRGKTFTAEDVRARCGDPPSPNILGGALSCAVRNKLIRSIGYVKTKRVSSKSRIVRAYVGR